MHRFISYLTLVAAVCLPFATQAADPQRNAEVAKRGADVMPFELKATTHVFTKTDTGGVQSVVAKDPGDAIQVDQVRKLLKEIQARCESGRARRGLTRRSDSFLVDHLTDSVA